MQYPRLLVNCLRLFSTTQFENHPILDTKALLPAFEGMGHLEESLPHAERPGQHELFTAAYIRYGVELPPDRIIVLNLQKFSALVSATYRSVPGVREVRSSTRDRDREAAKAFVLDCTRHF